MQREFNITLNNTGLAVVTVQTFKYFTSDANLNINDCCK